MAFSFSITATNDEARAGVISTPHGQLQTPGLLLHTSRGLLPFITKDNLETLRPEAVALQICAAHFMEYPGPSDLQSMGLGVHGLTGLDNYVLLANPRDPIMFCTTNKPEKADQGPQLVTPGGFRKVTPQTYMDTIAALQPDMFITLPDEIPGGSSRKRIKQSVDRTLKWAEACMEQHKQKPVAEGRAAVFVAVAGGDLPIERERAAEGAAKLAPDGFALNGFGVGEIAEARPELLTAAIKHLPASKPRHITGLGMPEEVLQSVGRGVDIFDSVYPYTVTINGCALVFPVEAHEAVEALKGTRVEDPEQGRTGMKLNLRSIAYKKDGRPILANCECLACQSHTRSYLHHILNCHEMLADVLLDIHNTHHYLKFFRAIREAIHQGRYPAYAEQMMQYFQSGRFM